MFTSIEQPKFNELLLESIVEGLKELGEDAPKVIFYHIWGTKELREDELAANIGIFVDSLNRMFGEGSVAVEHLILEKLSSKIGFAKALWIDVPLIDCVRYYKSSRVFPK